MPVSIHDISAIDQLANDLQIESHQIRKWRNAFYKHNESLTQSLLQINSSSKRNAFTEHISPSSLILQSSHDSDLDGATKLIFKLNRADHFIESVILRNKKGRTALCVSSQVGCAADCAFCATGKIGLRSQLSRDEILDQIILADQYLSSENRQVRNIVFMGMGEPFHNENALTESISILTNPKCFDFPPRNILVSTVGIPDAMLRFTRNHPRAGLALSLHSVDQTVRESIIPLAAHHPVDTLRETIRNIINSGARPPMIEWLMLQNINDSPSDARSLAEFLHNTNCHINLIPYNQIPHAPHLVASPTHITNQFADQLRKENLTVTIRRSLGSDITAACGQLAQTQTRISNILNT